jgi:endoglucanase
MTLPASAFPLSVSGSRLRGADGSSCSLGLGVNWGGAQQDEGVPYGLDVLPRSQIISRITGWGMSHVRLPYAQSPFVTNGGTLRTAPARASRLAANPDLIDAGMTPWQVWCQLADDLTAAGLYVILNQHLLFAGWCCSQADDNGLWYNDNWPSSTFSSTWFMIADRFAGNPRIGIDLHNEPRPAAIGGSVLTPTWGDGVWGTDFCRMYSWHVSQLRARGFTGLIFCEGLAYAGDLSAAGAHPVPGENVVYSVHDYSWYHQNADGSQQSRPAYYAANDARWGYLLTQGKAPVWVGEFGLNTDMSTAAVSTGWLPDFLAYYGDRQPCGGCWWELSATSVLGTEPATNVVKMAPGGREGFGLMAGQDWLGSQVRVLDLIRPVIA